MKNVGTIAGEDHDLVNCGVSGVAGAGNLGVADKQIVSAAGGAIGQQIVFSASIEIDGSDKTGLEVEGIAAVFAEDVQYGSRRISRPHDHRIIAAAQPHDAAWNASRNIDFVISAKKV